MNIAILGTGAVGSRLGRLLLDYGHAVVYGSRSPETAAVRVPDGSNVTSLRQAVTFGDVVVLATPWAGDTGRVTLDILERAGPFINKIVVDATNPLRSDWSPVFLGDQTSAGEQVAMVVPEAHVVKAFNTVFADIMTTTKLQRSGPKVTAFLCGNNGRAKDVVGRLASEIGFDPVDTGTLHNSRYLEAMAHLNIQIAVTMGRGTQGAFLYDQR
jgi:8-hydroxy-5-deazaflavin:NADPH oxidoreductase